MSISIPVSATDVFLSRVKGSACYRVILLLSLLPLAGCIATAPGSNGGGGAPTLSVTPATPNPTGGEVVVFTATTNAPNPQLTWLLGGANGTPCGTVNNNNIGTLNCGPGANQATFYAPYTVPTPNTVEIVTTLTTSSGTLSSTSTATILPSDVSITLAPTTATAAAGGMVSFAATVNGTSYQGGPTNEQVGWEVNGVANGGPTLGTITFVPSTLEYSPNVTYTAPANVTTGDSVTITAKSVADFNQIATATVTFTSSIQGTPAISISPNPATVAAGAQQTFTANVTNVTNPAVAWTVQGGSQYGTITANSATTTATYTAPSTVPSGGGTVTIEAEVQSASISNTATVTVTPAVVDISLLPMTATVASADTQLFTATVTGTTNQAVSWVVVGGSNNGTIVSTPPNSLTATYTAPTLQTGGSNKTVTVTAQSQADTSKTASATVTVTPPGTVTVTPTGTSIPMGGTQQFAASASGVTSFDWSVSAYPGSGCTASSLGSIDSNGLYTAPPLTATISSSPCDIQITATGGGDSGSVKADLHVTVTINDPSSAQNPSSIGAGANWLYTATVNGASTSNQGVSWTASTSSPGPCASPAGLFQSSVSPYTDPNGGFYYGPVCLPSSPITIKAASVFDQTQSQTTSLTVLPSDPGGSATLTSATTTCPSGIGGTTGASCYTLDVSCPGIADWPNTYLKVNHPSGTPLGTVILTSGSGGNYAYDVDPDFIESDGTTNGGLTVVNGILGAGFTTVQVAFSPLDDATEFSNGWLTGPGGVRRLACRYATLAQWVYTNIQKSTSVPMCATGNSGGAGTIGYALTIYGETNIFSMVETTSGPPMTRLDWGCSSESMTANFVCNSLPPQTLPFNFSVSEAEIVDPAYPSSEPFCSNAVKGSGTQAPVNLFLSDSILGGLQPTPTVDPPTAVNILLGGMDTSSAVQQGQHWGPAVGESTKSCVSDAPHAIPSVADGAQQIVTDIQNLCKLP